MSRRASGVMLALLGIAALGVSCARTVHDTEELPPRHDAGLDGAAGHAGQSEGDASASGGSGGAGGASGMSGAGAAAGQAGASGASGSSGSSGTGGTGGAGGSGGAGAMGGTGGAGGTSTGGTGGTGTGGTGGTGATGGTGGTGGTAGTGGGSTCPTPGITCGGTQCCNQKCQILIFPPIELEPCCLGLGLCGAVNTTDGGSECTPTQVLLDLYGFTCVDI